MKRYLLVLGAFVLLASCVNKNEKQAKQSGEEIYFEQSSYDYGEIAEDSDGIYKISFKNIGKEAIVINRVRSSCGCTIPSWPKEPIEAGSGGIIEVKYNTALTGSFMKSVYVYSSAKNSPVKLTVRGKVIPGERENTSFPEMPDKSE